jgi:signal transduction histidine kinase
MSFRGKLLTVFSLTVFLSVASVAWIVSSLARQAFEQADEARTAAFVAQFQREFSRQGQEVVHRIQAVASNEVAIQIAAELNRGTLDFGAHLNDAKDISDTQQLDFLEFVEGDGTIISSAQWPAKFGYKESALPVASDSAFLARQELPDGSALGLIAVREVNAGDKMLYVIGGRRVDQHFLATLELPGGMHAMFYENFGSGFSPQYLIDASGPLQNADRLAPLIEQVQQERRETSELVHWSSNAADDESVHAIPLAGQDKQLLGVLLLGSSRRPYVELRQHIRSAALLTGGAGVLLAILLSAWASARVTRPVGQLAEAAREVASGNWKAQVPVTSTDELGELAESFNRMTRELLEQRDRLVQAERVAAWRELARRLAHELKNPLFPLQLTVENLMRARQQGPELFEEMFQESASTLLAEIANLKGIISRFSEFSRMPQPQWRWVDTNELVRNVAKLFQAQLHGAGRPGIDCKLELAATLEPIAGDPELLHRVLSNLVLNAMDAMPEGGTITLATRQTENGVIIEVADTGAGLSEEECRRIFTPYYTSKAQGTGLGLAIVQSVVSDHGGKITLRSEPGRGTAFAIELPRNAEKVQSGGSERTVLRDCEA